MGAFDEESTTYFGRLTDTVHPLGVLKPQALPGTEPLALPPVVGNKHNLTALLTGLRSAGVVAHTYSIPGFAGSGTTGVVAIEHGRRFIGVELSEPYCKLAWNRLQGAKPTLFAPGQDAPGSDGAPIPGPGEVRDDLEEEEGVQMALEMDG